MILSAEKFIRMRGSGTGGTFNRMRGHYRDKGYFWASIVEDPTLEVAH